MSKLQKLKEQKESIHGDMVELKDSLGEGEAFTEEQIKQWDDLDEQLKAVDSQIATEERVIALSVTTPQPPPQQTPQFQPRVVSPRPQVNVEASLRGWALSERC